MIIKTLIVAGSAIIQPLGGVTKPSDSLEPKTGLRVVQGEMKNLRVVSADAEDKGVVPAGSTITRRVVFTNVSDHALYPKIATKSCACVSAEFSAPSVAPRQSVALTATIVPAAIIGPQTHVVTFDVWADEPGTHRLERGLIQVKYQADVSFVSSHAALTIESRLGTTGSGLIRFFHPRHTQLAQLGLADAQRALTLTYAPGPDDDAGEDQVSTLIRVSATPEKLGTTLYRLAFPTQPGERAPFEIQVRLVGASPVLVEPAGLMFNNDDPCRTITVRSSEPSLPAPEGLTVRSTAHWVEVRLDTSVSPPALRAELLPDAPDRAGCEIELCDAKGVLVARVPVVVWRDRSGVSK